MAGFCHCAFLYRMYFPTHHYACKAVPEQFRLSLDWTLFRK
ncbi:hypothetical protein J921_0149 [Acinetobacter baumannii 25493_8]|nr:hypothetical protein ACINNAV81_3751 [Acinetobacter baumannii Naval-81]EKK09646.1 hypothetical protein ACIN5162_1056 [Acinetobacter baumannii OIFC0162]EKU59107.1 hypothetical protein ACINWC348_1126 [Acinetobacter baumannii WC-348]EXA82386.1 hypothetical protein J523_0453 [Acinetobacter baumannii 1202252]EXC52178.1 hypothetical protein J470_3347 [Acinetobacter baumannii 1032241]EXC65677.1 hypothetical protein J489_0117 [Acinetobacter baumannii 1040094]EXD02511.1 hypothetical protein J495_119